MGSTKQVAAIPSARFARAASDFAAAADHLLGVWDAEPTEDVGAYPATFADFDETVDQIHKWVASIRDMRRN